MRIARNTMGLLSSEWGYATPHGWLTPTVLAAADDHPDLLAVPPPASPMIPGAKPPSPAASIITVAEFSFSGEDW